MQVSGVATSDDLASRYGQTRHHRRRTLWWMIGLAVSFVAVFTAWVVWAGLASDAGVLETTNTAHTIVDEHTVSVSFTINVEQGHPVSCAVEAMNSTFTIVGWRIVSYPATTQRLTAHTETVHTTEKATTGLIYRCWLT